MHVLSVSAVLRNRPGLESLSGKSETLPLSYPVIKNESLVV